MNVSSLWRNIKFSVGKFFLCNTVQTNNIFFVFPSPPFFARLFWSLSAPPLETDRPLRPNPHSLASKWPKLLFSSLFSFQPPFQSGCPENVAKVRAEEKKPARGVSKVHSRPGEKREGSVSPLNAHTHTHESGSTSVRPPCLLLPPSFFRRFFSSSSWVVGPSVGRSRSGRHCQAGHRLLALLYGRPAYVLLSLFSISLSLLSLCPRFTSNRLLLLLFFPLPGRLRR